MFAEIDRVSFVGADTIPAGADWTEVDVHLTSSDGRHSTVGRAVVCTPKGVAAHVERMGVLFGQHHMVLSNLSASEIQQAFVAKGREAESDTWNDVLRRLSSVMLLSDAVSNDVVRSPIEQQSRRLAFWSLALTIVPVAAVWFSGFIGVMVLMMIASVAAEVHPVLGYAPFLVVSALPIGGLVNAIRARRCHSSALVHGAIVVSVIALVVVAASWLLLVEAVGTSGSGFSDGMLMD